MFFIKLSIRIMERFDVNIICEILKSVKFLWRQKNIFARHKDKDWQNRTNTLVKKNKTKQMLQRSWPFFGLCVSRYSSTPSCCPGRITTQVRVRSTLGAFFAGFLGKFWTPNSSSQGSDGHSRHTALITERERQRQKARARDAQELLNILTERRLMERNGGRFLTTVFYIRSWGLHIKFPQEPLGVHLLFDMNLHTRAHTGK